jgi:hypothetical protein
MPKEKRHLDGGPLMPVSDPGEELHTPEYERRIAETLADRRPSRQEALERAERRERIATRLLAGYCANPCAASMTREALAELACLVADALVAELDRRRDAELQEARDA